MLVANEHSIAFHHHFHLTKIIANQGAATTHDIEDAVGKTDARTDFHTSCDDMYFGLDVILFQKTVQYIWIGGGNLFPIKPFYTRIVDALGNGEAQPTFAESQMLDDGSIFMPFHKFIFTNHANVGNSTCHTLRNVVVAQVEHFQWEIRGMDQKGALAGADFYIGFT